MICFQISSFEPLETTIKFSVPNSTMLWFAFKLVSLNHWKQPHVQYIIKYMELWFAFKLVSLNHWKQLKLKRELYMCVVICFQISIFEPLETTLTRLDAFTLMLWFAFKLVSLNHWKQPTGEKFHDLLVVICFQISIFEPLETTKIEKGMIYVCCDLLSN